MNERERVSERKRKKVCVCVRVQVCECVLALAALLFVCLRSSIPIKNSSITKLATFGVRTTDTHFSGKAAEAEKQKETSRAKFFNEKMDRLSGTEKSKEEKNFELCLVCVFLTNAALPCAINLSCLLARIADWLKVSGKPDYTMSSFSPFSVCNGLLFTFANPSIPL